MNNKNKKLRKNTTKRPSVCCWVMCSPQRSQELYTTLSVTKTTKSDLQMVWQSFICWHFLSYNETSIGTSWVYFLIGRVNARSSILSIIVFLVQQKIVRLKAPKSKQDTKD